MGSDIPLACFFLGQSRKRAGSQLVPTHCGLRCVSGNSSYNAISWEDCTQLQLSPC